MACAVNVVAMPKYSTALTPEQVPCLDHSCGARTEASDIVAVRRSRRSAGRSEIRCLSSCLATSQYCALDGCGQSPCRRKACPLRPTLPVLQPRTEESTVHRLGAQVKTSRLEPETDVGRECCRLTSTSAPTTATRAIRSPAHHLIPLRPRTRVTSRSNGQVRRREVRRTPRRRWTLGCGRRAG